MCVVKNEYSSSSPSPVFGTSLFDRLRYLRLISFIIHPFLKVDSNDTTSSFSSKMSNDYDVGNTDSTLDTGEQQQMQSRILMKKYKIAEACEFLHSLRAHIRNPSNPLQMKLATLWSLQLLTGVCDSDVDKTEKTIQLARNLNHLMTRELEAKLHRDVDFRIQVLSNQLCSDIDTAMTLKRNPNTMAARDQLEKLIQLQHPTQSAIDGAAALFESTSRNQAFDRGTGFHLHYTPNQIRAAPSSNANLSPLAVAAATLPIQGQGLQQAQGQQRDIFRFGTSRSDDSNPACTFASTNVDSQIRNNSGTNFFHSPYPTSPNAPARSTDRGTSAVKATFLRGVSSQQGQLLHQLQQLQQQQILQQQLQQLSLDQLLLLMQTTQVPSQNEHQQGQQYTQQSRDGTIPPFAISDRAERMNCELQRRRQQQDEMQMQAQRNLLDQLVRRNPLQFLAAMPESSAHANFASGGNFNHLSQLQSRRKDPQPGELDQKRQIQNDVLTGDSAHSAVAAREDAVGVDEVSKPSSALKGKADRAAPCRGGDFACSVLSQHHQDDQNDRTEANPLLTKPDPNESWEIRFEQLKEYKRLFGDCAVPQRYSANPKLATWVRTQRRMYKLMNAGEKTCMTPGRLHKLNSIGFVWEAR
ncbi:hypothetical protein ACHAXS_010003 [Conticribra weissflogii]